ncbi:DUF6508 domain-containing protein [Paenibacillus sp. KQZ6P-2]|uniref:DUF6508 domain-containing protein n=1 Tax=Paenibacillus mangrovi TaxID=2931978 RepID=A0A9X1WMZ5_9BACL|nr:DUF6508 domain-containing protein [Paenibacillus mangrovi]MCJ8010810.1 DUF6508 domain-containing protein [Paenibacillus mangrovi]
MTSSAIITQTEINQLLVYLEFFQGPSGTFYKEVNGWRCEVDTLIAFRKALSDTGFTMVFDWGAWIREHEIYRDIERDIEKEIMNADLETLRKLVTSYVRGDRFNEGLFLAVAMSGKIKQILFRLRQISAETPNK